MKIISMCDALPTVDGRYTVFVTDRMQRRWATPEIASFHGGRFDCIQAVYAWIGPWPSGLVEDLWPMVMSTEPAKELAEHIDAEILASLDCPVCHGDCAGANPPVTNCPMRNREKTADREFNLQRSKLVEAIGYGEQPEYDL